MPSNLRFANLKISFDEFWPLQFLFWSGLCLITFVTLTLWYGQIGWRHITHTGVQGVLGLILSTPLHFIFRSIWHHVPWQRVIISFIAVALIAALWNVCRMMLFIWLTNETTIWQDFGGWYFGAIFVFLCWTALYHGIRYYQLLQVENLMKLEAEASAGQEKLKRLLAETEAKDAQLKMLRYQLNPHFLFNTLNAINSLVGIDQATKAQSMIVKLSRFLRYSLDNNPDMKITVDREVEALILYLDIEKTRFGSRLELDFEVAEDAEMALIPSLLIQPLIENSMKYAIAKSEEGGVIRLRVTRSDAWLLIALSDSGAGENATNVKAYGEKGRGIGLRNTIDRLKAFYDTQYEFDIEQSAQGGLKTIIKIPYEVVKQ